MQAMTFSVAVAGATGYAGSEILRLLLAHPDYQSGKLSIGALTGGSNAGASVAELMPHLTPLAERQIQETSAETLRGHDAVFLALPHGHSAEIAQQLPESTIIIDCGADFRLKDAAAWQHFYGTEHQGTWVYGLPELLQAGEMQPLQSREAIAQTTRIAVPGCFPTGGSIAIAPALAAGLIEPKLNVVSISGTSGAGKKPAVSLLGSEVMGNIKAYNTAGKHRHLAEFIQNLSPLGDGKDFTVSYTPVAAPTARGILTTVTAPLADPNLTSAQARDAYRHAYAEEPFVHVLADGQQPQTASVVGANMVQLQVEVDAQAGLLLITAAIDNLTKGTAGAAVQCLNIIRCVEETAGLPLVGVAP